MLITDDFVKVPGKSLLSGGYAILYDEALGFALTFNKYLYFS